MTASKHDHHAQSLSALGLLAMVMTLLAWTAAPLLMKHFTDVMDVWTMNGWRYGAAALCWAPLILLRYVKGTFPNTLWRDTLWPTVFNCFGQVTLASAFYRTDPTMVAFGLRAQLITVAVGGAFFFAAERRIIRKPAFLAGMLLVLVGVGLYLRFHPDFGIEGSGTLIGAGLGALSGVIFGGYALSIRPLMKRHPPILSYAVISAYTAAVMLALMFLFGERLGGAALDLSPVQFVLLIASAIVALFIGHPCYYIAIRSLGVSATATVLQLQPITVGIGALIFLGGEMFSALQIGAGSLAIASAIFMLRVQQRLARQDRDTREADAAHDLDQEMAIDPPSDALPEPIILEDDPHTAAAGDSLRT